MKQTTRPRLTSDPAVRAAPQVEPHREIFPAESIKDLHRNPNRQSAVFTHILHRRNLAEDERIKNRFARLIKINADRRPEAARFNLHSKRLAFTAFDND